MPIFRPRCCRSSCRWAASGVEVGWQQQQQHSISIFLTSQSKYCSAASNNRAESYRNLVTQATAVSYQQKRKSPYLVLGIPPTATTEQIKKSFRKLALQYHPDLRDQKRKNENYPSLIHDYHSDDDLKTTMEEIVDAYERLMDRDCSMLLTPGNSQLASACEVLTLKELMEDRRFDVHAIWMRYRNDCDDDDDEIHHDEKQEESSSSSSTTTTTTSQSSTTRQLHSALSITIHPDSSVTDLKHELQDMYMKEWNLQSRRKDRYGLAIGWELVVPSVVGGGEGNGGVDDESNTTTSSSTTTSMLTTLGNHDFIKHTYGIQSNTLIYAIIQKNEMDSMS